MQPNNLNQDKLSYLLSIAFDNFIEQDGAVSMLANMAISDDDQGNVTFLTDSSLVDGTLRPVIDMTVTDDDEGNVIITTGQIVS